MTPIPGPPYEWDDDKSQLNFQRRGFGFDLIHSFAWNTATTRRDLRSVAEERWISTGLVEERLYVAVWTWRGTATRIISLRKANRREAIEHAQARG